MRHILMPEMPGTRAFKPEEGEFIVGTTNGAVPQSRLAEHNARMKEHERRRLEEERAKAAAAPRENCPLLDGMNTTCRGHACALYGDGCALARLADGPAARDTRGLMCPLNRYKAKCTENCVLYRSGCVITTINKNNNNEEA